jgi:hypothetical protein
LGETQCLCGAVCFQKEKKILKGKNYSVVAVPNQPPNLAKMK